MRRTRALLAMIGPRTWLVLAAIPCFAVVSYGVAATINVNTTVDELDFIPNGTCSLREAIVTVNEQRGIGVGGCSVSGTLGNDDVIVLPAGTYQLTRLANVTLVTNDQDFD